jgi:hypothetical protein
VGHGKELAEAGYPDMSSAVRPMAVAPDERFVYLQVSFFHGFVEFDTQAPDADPAQTYDGEPAVGAVRRVVPLPDRTSGMPREQYGLDSAHHGLAINEGRDDAVRRRDDVGLCRDRRPGEPARHHRRRRREAVLGDQRRGRRRVLGLGQR